MYKFIPYLPLKELYDNPVFRDQPTLEAVLVAMMEKKAHFKGQIEVHPDYKRAAIFNGIRDLRRILKEMKIEETSIAQIYIYRIGAFRKFTSGTR